ncbi:MAG: hypothetical protein EAZ89_09245 [Bacteroidetes bacterium]|nr:MAG: hypothetical protein EAZ89_09245 [Bacteroidota bacterium]
MNEKNRHTLDKALRKLPQHSAPEDAWAQIEASLSHESSETAPMRDALKKLPLYEAPEGVWPRIEWQLQAGMRVVRRHSLLAAAAVALCIVSIGALGYYLRQAPESSAPPLQLSERQQRGQVHLTEAEIAVYQSEIAGAGHSLDSCLKLNPEAGKEPDIAAALVVLGQVRDSLRQSLEMEADTAAQRLRMRHSLLQEALRSRVCP